MQAKSPYDIIVLYGTGDSNNIAVSLGVLNIPAICYNNGRKNTAAEYNNKTNNTLSLAAVLKSISDDKSSSIFQLIANVNSKQNIKEIESEHKAILLQNICHERNWPYKNTEWKILSYSFW